MKICFIFYSIAALAALGCSTIKVNTNEVHADSVLIPKDLLLAEDEIAHLRKASDEGNCKASYRLYQYYAFCTTEIEVALDFVELALEQGCSHVVKDIENIKNALGED